MDALLKWGVSRSKCHYSHLNSKKKGYLKGKKKLINMEKTNEIITSKTSLMSRLIVAYMTLNHDFSMAAYVGWKLLPKDTKGRFNVRGQEATWNAICKVDMLTSGCNIVFKCGKKIILLILLLGLASESQCLCLFVLALLWFSLFLIFGLMCSSLWVSEFTYFYNSSLGQFHFYFLLYF